MKFDQYQAEALMRAEKIFLAGIWLPMPNGNSLTTGMYSDKAPADRLESKIYISSGSNNKASFTLLMRVVGWKQRWRIYALDWNPTAPHVNPLKLQSEHSGKIFRPGETHEHHFANRSSDENPDAFAVPISDDLPDYHSALNHFCARINAVRPPHLPEPTEQGTLL